MRPQRPTPRSRVTRVARAELEARDQLALYDDVEVPLALVLAKMERAGVALDPEALVDLRARSTPTSSGCKARSTLWPARVQHRFAAAARPGALRQAQVTDGGKNKTGWATGVEVLAGLARSIRSAAKVLEWREVTKLKNTYIDVMPALVDPRDGRLHTVFNQTATATGRLSSTNPNLQNIPVRSELGRQIRRAFVAGSPSTRSAGRRLQADRTAADGAPLRRRGDARSVRERQDIHDFTARQIFEIGPFARRRPQPAAHGQERQLRLVLRHVGFRTRAAPRDRPRASARNHRGLLRALSRVRGYIDRCLADGRERGYVSTILGRRRYMPDLAAKNYMLRAAAEREATNAPLQGSAADLMKLAMVRIDRALGELR